MIPTQILVDQFRYETGRMAKLAEGVDDADFATVLGGVRNHAAWTLTHCIVANGELLFLLNKPRSHPENWATTASPGVEAIGDRSRYPAKDELISALRAQADLVDAATIDGMDLDGEYPTEQLRPFFPTRGHGVAYFLTDHLTHHLGQLLAWRRALRVERGEVLEGFSAR